MMPSTAFKLNFLFFCWCCALGTGNLHPVVNFCYLCHVGLLQSWFSTNPDNESARLFTLNKRPNSWNRYILFFLDIRLLFGGWHHMKDSRYDLGQGSPTWMQLTVSLAGCSGYISHWFVLTSPEAMLMDCCDKLIENSSVMKIMTVCGFFSSFMYLILILMIYFWAPVLRRAVPQEYPFYGLCTKGWQVWSQNRPEAHHARRELWTGNKTTRNI